MTASLLSLVAVYGPMLVFVSAFASCLFAPVPTSLIMLAAGAFVASGDLVGWQVVLAAFAGAVIGDQTGFHIGRLAEGRIERIVASHPRHDAMVERARNTLDRWGGTSVFLSRWLFAPIGPWVNLVAGASGLGWLRFTIWDTLGEAIWVGFYFSLGYFFADHIVQLASVMANSVGLLVASLASVALGLMLLRERERRRQ